MTQSLYRLLVPGGSVRWANGQVGLGPEQLLPLDTTLAGILAGGAASLAAAASPQPGLEAVPPGVKILAPIDDQEVWAAGVTYKRSRDARLSESSEPSVYDRIYDSPRPELFFKSVAHRVRATGERIGIRADADWNVPEPELALVIAPSGEIAGLTIGNDVSSRDIEGANPLYLPQAKVYEGACALGPSIVPFTSDELTIELRIDRGGSTIFEESCTTGLIVRDFNDLADYLLRALPQPQGVVLLTGTGIVPGESFTLEVGDFVAITISGLGTLENTVERVGRR